MGSGALVLLEECRPVRTVHRHHGHVVERVEKVGVLGVGEDELAVGAAYVGGQRGSAAGRVEPDHHEAPERGGAQGQQEVGGVLQQDAHVGRAVVLEQRAQCGRALVPLRHDLGPRQPLVLEQQAVPVVVRACQEEVPDGGPLLGHGAAQAGSAASTRPMASACSVVPPKANSSRLAVVK